METAAIVLYILCIVSLGFLFTASMMLILQNWPRDKGYCFIIAVIFVLLFPYGHLANRPEEPFMDLFTSSIYIVLFTIFSSVFFWSHFKIKERKRNTSK